MNPDIAASALAAAREAAAAAADVIRHYWRRGVEVERELIVRQALDEGCGRGSVDLCALARAGHRVGKSEHRDCGRLRRCLAELLRRDHRAAGPVLHRLLLRAVEVVPRELDQQCDRVG